MVQYWSKNFAKNKCKLSVLLLVTLLMISTAVTLWLVDPLAIYITRNFRVTPNSLIHELLKKEMAGVQLSIYLFNITNEKRFLSGEDYKLKLHEVGPFTYQETTAHEDLEINPEKQELRYSPRVKVSFVEEISVADAQEVILTLPNIAMLSAATAASSRSFVAKGAFNLLAARYHSSSTINVSVHDFLWGYRDSWLTLGNSLMPGVYSFDKLGVLDRFYDTKSGNALVLSARDEDKFMIKSRNGLTKLQRSLSENVDTCEECSTFDNAYEGILFPSPLTPERPVRIYRPGLCKVIDMVFKERRTMDNYAEGFVYTISDDFYSWNGDKSMQLDMTSCFMGIPLSITQGHFLGLDPSLYERIEGVTPDPSKNNSFIIIEPMTGIGLDTYISIQMNMIVRDLSFNKAASPFSNIILPLAYVEIKQLKLPEELNRRFVFTNYTWPKILLSARIVLSLIVVFLVYYLFRILKRKPDTPSYSERTLTTTTNQEKVKVPLI